MKAETPRTGFWVGYAVTSAGDTVTQFTVLALCTQTLNLSAAQTSLVLATPMVATLFGFAYAGFVSDVFDRRQVYLASLLARSVIVAGLGVLVSLGRLTSLLLAGSLLLLAILQVCGATALRASIRSVFGDEEVGVAQGRVQSIRAITDTAGGAAGGIVVAGLGAVGALAIDCVSFLVGYYGVQTSAWRDTRSRERRQGAWRDRIKRYWSGIRTTLRARELTRTFLVSGAANFLIAGTTVPILWLLVTSSAFPLLAYGILMSVGSAAVAVAATLLGRYTPRGPRDASVVQAAALACYGGAFFVYLLVDGWTVRSIVFSVIAEVIAGAAIGVFTVANATRQVLAMPDELQGGGAALRSSVNGSASLAGTAMSALAISVTGDPRIAIAVAGGALVALAIGLLLSRERKTV